MENIFFIITIFLFGGLFFFFIFLIKRKRGPYNDLIEKIKSRGHWTFGIKPDGSWEVIEYVVGKNPDESSKALAKIAPKVRYEGEAPASTNEIETRT